MGTQVGLGLCTYHLRGDAFTRKSLIFGIIFGIPSCHISILDPKKPYKVVLCPILVSFLSFMWHTRRLWENYNNKKLPPPSAYHLVTPLLIFVVLFLCRRVLRWPKHPKLPIQTDFGECRAQNRKKCILPLSSCRLCQKYWFLKFYFAVFRFPDPKNPYKHAS